MPPIDHLKRYAKAVRSGHRRYVSEWPKQIGPDELNKDRRATIDAALDWIARSQDATVDGGSAAYFSPVTDKWSASYPETTGYIICSLLEAVDTLEMSPAEAAPWLRRAHDMAHWLADIQREDGSFQGGTVDAGAGPVLFNTGQILHGLLHYGLLTADGRILEAADRTATWMVDNQDTDGGWTRAIYDVGCRAYYARAAWPLAEAGRVNDFARHEQFAGGAARFADWVLNRLDDTGWIDSWSFFEPNDKQPFNTLHTIAYTIEGLLEIGLTLDYDAAIEGAKLSAEALLVRLHADGMLMGEYRPGIKPAATYACCTGSAQMGRTWGRLHELTGRDDFKEGMQRVNAGLAAVQPGPDSPDGIRGGFPGSVPIHNRYQANRWINWAPKFALDSLLIEQRIMRSAASA
ncbi:MAG: hypothetical protein ACPGUC_03835 [Gammaproteobacteria bacterium]